MRILLTFPHDVYGRYYNIIPPVSLGYIASGLRRGGFDDITICDLRLNRNVDAHSFAKRVKNERFDVVGFYLFSSLFKSAFELTEAIKEIYPECITVAGGVHPIFEPVQTLAENPYFDFAFHGEGEEAFPEFLKTLNDSDKFPSIPNLVWRENGHVKINCRTFLDDLAKCPMPAWDLIDVKEYPLVPFGLFSRKKLIGPIIATRGCPYQCAYCGAPNASGKIIRRRPPEDVVSEIDYLVSKYGVEEIHFLDDNLTFNKDYILKLCDEIKRAKLPIIWSCPNGVRLDRLDREILESMERAGCYSLAVGIEAGTQKVLDLMRRKVKVETLSEKIELIKRYTKIWMTGLFIIGYPGATHEDDEETIKFALSLPLNRVSFFSFCPFPGSYEYEKLKREGKPPDIISLDNHKVSYVSDGRTALELKKLRYRAYLKFYLRPKVLPVILKEVKSLSQLYYGLKRVFD